MSFCSNCGSKIPDNASFCINCGAAVNKPAEHQEPKENAGYQQNPAESNAPDYQQKFYENKAQQEQNYQQPPYQQNSRQTYQQPMGTYRADVPRRDIAICIILSVVTCGIYGLYWYYKLIGELNVAAPDDDSPSAITVLLLTIITCGIYGCYWLYKAGNRLDNIRQLNGEAPSSLGLLFVILSICQLAIADYCLIQNELNKISLN